MACTIKIAKDIQSKYGLPEEMPEADFNAWLANGGLQLLANDGKISVSGYNIIDNKFIESLGIGKKLKEYVKTTVQKLNKMVYGAEESGSKTGAKEERSNINFLQDEARAFLKENKITSNEAIEKAIGKIRNNLTFARFLVTVQSQQDAAAYFAKAEEVKELLKEISKLKKSDKLTASNKKFIENTSFPSAMEVSDLDTYAAILQEFIDKRNGESTFGNINEKLTKFIEKENAYINSYKSNIAALKEMLEDLALEEEYEALIKEGTFEGTGIESFEDYKKFWLSLDEFLGVQAETEKELEKIGKSKRVAEVTQNIKTTLEQFAKELKQAFDLASTEGMKLDFSILEKGDLSVLSLKELVLLSNILDGILYDGDFTGYDNIRSKLEQSKRKAGLLEVLKDVTGKIRRLLDISEKSMRPVPTTITSAAFGVVSEAKLTSFIFGMWNAMISQVERLHNISMSEFDKRMRDFGSKAFESSVAVEAFGFINQWDEGITAAEQKEQFKNDTAVYAASAKALYDQNILSLNPKQETNVKVQKAKYALQALERFGIIKDLVFSDKEVTFTVNDNLTHDDIQGKLNPKEQAFYDFLIDSFAKNRAAFINGMQIGLGLPFRGVVNYFPRFSDITLKDDTDANIKTILSGFSGVSRTQDRAKARGKATGNYSIGLRENFSKGLWQNLLVAYGQQEINDMVNSIYSSQVGIKSLQKDKLLTSSSVAVIMNAVTNQVKKELTYGNVSLKSEYLIAKQFGNMISSMYYGFVLNHIFQLPKQTIPALLTSYGLQPGTTNLTNKILLNTDLTNKIVEQTTVVRRNFKHLMTPMAKAYPVEYLTGAAAGTYKFMRFAEEKLKIGDIVKPVINKVRAAFGKEVKTEQLLDFGDTFISKFNIVAGYIDYLKKTNKGITDAEILDKLNNEPIDESALAAAETWQQQLNSISAPAQQGKVLSSTGLAQILYMFKSFQVNTHQEFLKNMRRLAFNGKHLTKAEIWQNVKSASAYAIQQAAFRATAAFLTQLTLAALTKGKGDDDKDKIYKNEKILTQFLIGLGNDIFFGSAGVIGDIAIGLASNFYWDKQKEEYIKEIRETDPNFDPKGTPLDPNIPLSVEPTIGGSLFAAWEFVKKQIEEWGEEAEILEKAGLPTTSALLYPILKTIAFITASGTGRDIVTGANNLQNKEVDRINALMGEIKGQYGFEFEFENKEDLIKLSKTDISPRDLAKLSYFEQTSAKHGILFVLTKADMESARKNTNIALYGKNNPTQADVLNSIAMSKVNLNPNASDEAKMELARKQYKEALGRAIKAFLKNAKAYSIVAKK